jgi:YggT family protein
MDALIFLVKTLLSLVLFVMLLRVLLQLARADFRNPLAQAVVRLTNWLVLPLRRVLPPVRRIDTASIVAVVIVAFVEIAILYAMRFGGLPPALVWLRATALELLHSTLWLYFYAIILYALLSLIAAGTYSPFQSVLAALCEPVLSPFRRLIPNLAGLDLSPLWALIAIQAILILVG